MRAPSPWEIVIYRRGKFWKMRQLSTHGVCSPFKRGLAGAEGFKSLFRLALNNPKCSTITIRP
jgi:hypothetical protein